MHLIYNRIKSRVGRWPSLSNFYGNHTVIFLICYQLKTLLEKHNIVNNKEHNVDIKSYLYFQSHLYASGGKRK